MTTNVEQKTVFTVCKCVFEDNVRHCWLGESKENDTSPRLKPGTSCIQLCLEALQLNQPARFRM